MFDRKAKYVIWDDGITECAIVFNNHLTHANMAMMLNIKYPISAGFVEFKAVPNHFGSPIVQAIVSGESMSLNIKSRSGDAVIIERVFKITG